MDYELIFQSVMNRLYSFIWYVLGIIIWQLLFVATYNALYPFILINMPTLFLAIITTRGLKSNYHVFTS